MIDVKAFISALRGSYLFRRQSSPEITRMERSLQRIEERIIEGRKVPHQKKLETARRRLRIEVSIALHDAGLTSITVNSVNAPTTFALMTGGSVDAEI